MPTLNRPARALRSEHIVMMRAILKAGGRPKAVRGQGGSSQQAANEAFQIFQYPNSILVPGLGGAERQDRSSSTGDS
jgi:hypothetical protein